MSRAFTIIELLVVTGIIILLLSILVVAVNGATRSAQKSRTIALMNSMKQGLIRFKEDIGYYPPVLGVPTAGGPPGNIELRRLYPNSVPNPMSGYIQQMQAYYSTCTLADYLIGYGHHYQDGFGATGSSSPTDWSSESPPLGIRHPGPDGVWGASLVTSGGGGPGALDNRMKMFVSGSYSNGSVTSPLPIDQGKVFGSYLELKDERLLAAVAYVNGNLTTFFQGDVLPAGETWDTMPKAIVDYWGMPIRYYRRPYPPGALHQSYRQHPGGSGFRLPTLSDVYVLRPQEIKPGTESISPYADQGNPPVNVSTRDLDAAEFALLSSGPDKLANNDATLHEHNKDNIVEVGP